MRAAGLSMTLAGAAPASAEPGSCRLGGVSAQDAEQLVEQGGDLAKDRVQWEPAVEQAGDGAEEVADEFTGSGLGGDGQVHGVQVHLQSEQVEVQRAEDEVEDLTGPGACRQVDGDRQLLAALGA